MGKSDSGNDVPDSGKQVKEPPLPQTQGIEEKFPRQGEVDSAVEDGARIG